MKNNNQIILFIGDSITDCDRKMSIHSPLGWGYVRQFSDILKLRESEKQIQIINKGINENTISNLLNRWNDDVIEFQPGLLFILIGINDVTRYIGHAHSLHSSPEEFKTIYKQLIEKTKLHLPNCKIIPMQPFYISREDDIFDSNRNRMILTLAEYNQVIDDIVLEYGLKLIKLSEIFKDLLLENISETYSEDKIHPNIKGHNAIAETIYRELLELKDNSHV